MTPEKRTCASCAAYDADELICRRNPPRTDGWPTTSAIDWCLAHKPRDDAGKHDLGSIGWDADLFGDLTELLNWLGEGKTIPEIGQYLGLTDTQQVPLALAMEKLRDIGITRQKKWKIMRATTEADEPTPPPTIPPTTKTVRRSYTEAEFLNQFPFGEKAALPLPVIRKRACANLCISDARFSDERFNLMTQGKINKVTLPSGEDRYFR